MTPTLRGQRVVVGGTSGMGLGAVRAAAEVGAEVQVAGRVAQPEGAQIKNVVVDWGMAVRPHRRFTIVSAAFAAVEALSRALAVELGPLRVNTIRPGLIDSDMWSFLDDEAREQLRQKVRR